MYATFYIYVCMYMCIYKLVHIFINAYSFRYMGNIKICVSAFNIDSERLQIFYLEFRKISFFWFPTARN